MLDKDILWIIAKCMVPLLCVRIWNNIWWHMRIYRFLLVCNTCHLYSSLYYPLFSPCTIIWEYSLTPSLLPFTSTFPPMASNAPFNIMQPQHILHNFFTVSTTTQLPVYSAMYVHSVIDSNLSFKFRHSRVPAAMGPHWLWGIVVNRGLDLSNEFESYFLISTSKSAVPS